MYTLMIITCFLLLVPISGRSTRQLFDETTYNPCGTSNGLYFYPDPTDIHQYYQCDGTGTAYSRSCGELVWDTIRVTCDWPSAVAPPTTPPPTTVSPTTTPAPYIPITTYNPCGTIKGLYFYPDPTDIHQYYQCDGTGTAYSRSCGALVWDIIQVACNWPSTVAPPTPPSPTTVSPTVTPAPLIWTTTPSSTTVYPPSSLCTPINPCGEHGECIESPQITSSSARRFACICKENWFGRVCDKRIDELTTPSTRISDEKIKGFGQNHTFSSPIQAPTDPKLIFYGLKGSNTVPDLLESKKNE